MFTCFKKQMFVLLSASSILLTSPVFAEPSAAEIIESKLGQYEARFNRGDAQAVASLFSEDVIYYGPTGQVHHGREAVQQRYQSNMAAGFSDMTVDVIEIQVFGVTAYDIARYTITDPGGNRLSGYHLALLVKEDGEWSVKRTLVNAVMPAPPAN